MPSMLSCDPPPLVVARSRSLSYNSNFREYPNLEQIMNNTASRRSSSVASLPEVVPRGGAATGGNNNLNEANLVSLNEKILGLQRQNGPILPLAVGGAGNQKSSSSKNRSTSLREKSITKNSSDRSSRRTKSGSLPPLYENEAPVFKKKSEVIDFESDGAPLVHGEGIRGAIDLDNIDVNNLTAEQKKYFEAADKTLIKTYPYPVVKGVPTYETDYALFGMPQLTEQEVRRLEKGGALPSLDKSRNRSPKNQRKQKVKKTADGKPVPRPPLSRSTSVGDLEEVYFQGPNFAGQGFRKQYVKKGLRLSKCYDNVASFGASSWQTNNANYGSVVKPSVLHQKRSGLVSFELLRFLPDHPHWKVRLLERDAYGNLKREGKSTYMDLGSYYIDGKHLPREYRYCQPPKVTNELLL